MINSSPQPTPITPPLSPPSIEVKRSPFKYFLTFFGLLLVLILGWLLVTKVILPRRVASTPPVTEIIYWGLWEPNEVLTSIFAQFENQNPGVKVNYVQQKSQDYRERLQTSFSSNQGPDLFRFHHTWVPMLKNDLALLPSQIYSSADFQTLFYPVANEWLKGNRGIYGIPLEIDGLGLFYNTTIFSSAGKTPPTTWEDLRVVAKQLAVINKEQLQRGGVALGTTNNVEHWSDILGVMLLQNAADPAKPNNTNGQDALTFYVNFNTLDHVWDSTMPPSTYAFATEKVAMILAPSWRAFDIHDLNPNLRFAIAPIPQLPDSQPVNWASFWAEGVSSHSSKSKQEIAWKLLQYLSQKETLRQLYAAASTVRLFGEPFSRVDMADQLRGDQYTGAYISTAPTMKSWYLCSATHDNGLNDGIIKYYEDALNKILTGEPALKALTTTEQGIDQILSKYQVAR